MRTLPLACPVLFVFEVHIRLPGCINSANQAIKCLVGSGIAMILLCVTQPGMRSPKVREVAGWLVGTRLPSTLA